jgi:heme exporter protein CcmD
MTSIPNFGYIVASFAVAAVAIAAMIAAVWWDYRDLLAKLARLENGREERR